MSDYPIDTPPLGRLYCPGCEPEVDCMQEIVEVHYCHLHEPPRYGIDDAGLPGEFYGVNQEAGGASNKAACDFIHRARAR